MDDKYFLKLAVEQTKKSVEAGGFPAGSVIVKDGNVIAEGISNGYLLHDPTEHSDTSAIKKACKSLETIDLSGSTLYSSIEGCNMCFSVAIGREFQKLFMAVEKLLKWLKSFITKV